MHTSLVTKQSTVNLCDNGYNPQYVVAFLEMLGHPSSGGVIEIRILPKDPYLYLNQRRTYVGKTVVGYYDPDHYQKAARDIAAFDGQAQVYVCLNPCKSELLARAANHLQYNAQYTASDADVLCLQWFRMDFDPVRPSGISSSDDELSFALECRDEMAFELEQHGAQVIRAMSGNGAHLLVRLPDYPNDAEHGTLVETVTKDLAQHFSTLEVQVDTSVTNASRIWKVYGTLAVKGDNIPSRPHRRATIEMPAVSPETFDLWPLYHRITKEAIRTLESSPALDDSVSRRNRAYALAALDGETEKVKNASDGQKHTQLLKSATALGGLVHDGAVTDHEIKTSLFDAVKERAADKQQAIKTIHDGIAYGEQNPRVVPKAQIPARKAIVVPPSFPENPQTLIEPLRPVPVLSPQLVPEALRRWLEDIAERIACPLEFVVIPALIALASLIGRKVAIRPKRCDDWQVTPNLWGAIIGSPSSFKTPAVKEALRPISRLVGQAHQQYLEAMRTYQEQKIISDTPQDLVEPVERRYIINDATVPALGQRLAENPNGLLQYRDELMGWLKSLEKENAEADRPFYLETWNGTNENYVYDRIGRGTLHIPHVCLSILGTIQPGPLQQYVRAASGGAKADGLLQRFQLMVWPDPVRWCNVDRLPDKDAKNRAFAVFEAVDGLSPQELNAQQEEGCSVPFLRFADDAQELFDKWRRDLELEKLDNPQSSAAMSSHLAKYRSLMPSLALLFHVIESVDGVCTGIVSRDCAEAAAAWCDFLEEHARRIYNAESAESARGAQIIADRLDDLPAPFTERDVHRKGWRDLTKKDDVTNALARLEEKHWIKGVEFRDPAGENGGRPTRRYFVNPQVGRQEDA